LKRTARGPRGIEPFSFQGEKDMKERSVTHSTDVIERSYPTSPERVFAAFADPAKKSRWFSTGGQAGDFEMDFRAGGKERKSFRIKDGPACENQTTYQDILPNRRIVFVYTMSLGDTRISSSQATVELLATENGTDLIFTEQGAFFEGADGPQIREAGWRQLLEKLASELAR
jgi:uncharacterized protein YndB with AHSA1/START domain